MFRDVCVCFLVLALYICDVVGQYTLTGPTSAAEGSTVTFTCTTSPVPIGVSWSEKSGSNINSYIYYYNSSARLCQRSSGAPPSDYTFDCNSTGVFSLSFPVDYSRHRGSMFKCRHFAGLGESNTITLSVTGVYTLTGPTTTAIGSTVTFTCTTSPQQSTVTWSETSGFVTNNYLYFYNSAEGRCQRSSGAPPSDYTLDCNSTGVFSLSFPANYSRHRCSVFQCSNPGQGESNIIILSVTDVTCSCDIKEEVTSSSNQILLGAGIVLFTLSVVITSTLAIIFFRQKHTKKDGHNTRGTEDQYDNLEGKTGNTYEELQQSQNQQQSAAYNNTETNF